MSYLKRLVCCTCNFLSVAVIARHVESAVASEEYGVLCRANAQNLEKGNIKEKREKKKIGVFNARLGQV